MALPSVFRVRLLLAALVAMTVLAAQPAAAQYRQGYGPQGQGQNQKDTYSNEEIVREGHRFFGTASRELAELVEKAASRWGRPNAYILGEEGSGAFIAGLRYGDGTMFTRSQGQRKVYWQGPTLGWDFGGNGTRVMMLVYNLPFADAIYRRFGGMNGSAYVVGGFGMTAVSMNNIVIVPIQTGVGLRLGINVGYLKFTPKATWVPF